MRLAVQARNADSATFSSLEVFLPEWSKRGVKLWKGDRTDHPGPDTIAPSISERATSSITLTAVGAGARALGCGGRSEPQLDAPIVKSATLRSVRALGVVEEVRTG